MKIVTFDNFVRHPAGVIFSYYDCFDTDSFRGLFRKGDTVNDADFYNDDKMDYFEYTMLPEYDDENQLKVGIKRLWNEFDEDQRYVIYEKEDIDKLKEMLQ